MTVRAHPRSRSSGGPGGLRGRQVAETTMAIYESARQDGARVSFPLEITTNPLAQMLAEGLI